MAQKLVVYRGCSLVNLAGGTRVDLVWGTKVGSESAYQLLKEPFVPPCQSVKSNAMSLADDIKKGMFAAMKAKNTVEKEILRVALGEIQTAASRAEDEKIDDKEVQAILKKLIKSNREAIAATSDAEGKAKLEEEITSLQNYLPQSLTVEQIVDALASVAEQIKAAPSQGPAMGVAMKTLKQAGAEADSKDVAAAVGKLRA